MSAHENPAPSAATLLRWSLRVMQALCWACLIPLAIPVVPVALVLEWVEERLYGRARTVSVLRD